MGNLYTQNVTQRAVLRNLGAQVRQLKAEKAKLEDRLAGRGKHTQRVQFSWHYPKSFTDVSYHLTGFHRHGLIFSEGIFRDRMT